MIRKNVFSVPTLLFIYKEILREREAIDILVRMVGSRLFVFIIAVCASFAFSAVVYPNANTHPQLQRRTWDQAIALAKAFVANLTLEEKCRMTGGVGGRCVGNVFPVPRLNFDGMCYQDSPSGVGDRVLHSTAFAAGIHIAAAWDRDLFYQRGVAIGKEFRGKGVHFALGPMMNIDRNARHGSQLGRIRF